MDPKQGQRKGNDSLRRIALLGSTGSIGRNALDVVAKYPARFRVALLACRQNADLILKQAEQFQPQWVAIDRNVLSKDQLNELRGWGIRVAEGPDELRGVLKEADFNLELNAVVGSAALLPTLDVLERGIDVALANKETLVMAGPLVMASAKEHGATIFPIDSEHSAIHQCLRGEDPGTVARIILTASGGPFRNARSRDLSSVTVRDVLNHPTWEMGPKITVDSATLMNKGLEIIEAHYLFDVPPEAIIVWIHPQSIVHSMVEFVDGSVKAQLSTPDMRLPILYALTGGDRNQADLSGCEGLTRPALLEFEEPDVKRFPCLNLAYRALETGGTAPAVLSSADEEAVSRFLQGKIAFTGIYELVSAALDAHDVVFSPGIDDILNADQWARSRVRELVSVSG